MTACGGGRVAGARANAVLAAGIARAAPQLVDEGLAQQRAPVLAGGTTAAQLQVALAQVRSIGGASLSQIEPEVSQTALRKLKFSELLPPELAVATLGGTFGRPSRGPGHRRHAGHGHGGVVSVTWFDSIFSLDADLDAAKCASPGRTLEHSKGVLTTISDARS